MAATAMTVELAEATLAVLVLAERFAQSQDLIGATTHADASRRAIGRFRVAMVALAQHMDALEREELRRRLRLRTRGATVGALLSAIERAPSTTSESLAR